MSGPFLLPSMHVQIEVHSTFSSNKIMISSHNLEDGASIFVTLMHTLTIRHVAASTCMVMFYYFDRFPRSTAKVTLLLEEIHSVNKEAMCAMEHDETSKEGWS